ncbi:MAG TPA: NYN domain-containing protein [archaeon]|nr:NYN domain-containing protein [archaeon]
MNTETNKERIAVFIDGSNLYHSVKDTFGVHDNETLPFGNFIEELRKGRLLVGTYYYNAALDRGRNPVVYSKQQKFFSNLRKIPGFNVILCNMRKIRKSDGTFEYAVKGDIYGLQ